MVTNRQFLFRPLIVTKCQSPHGLLTKMNRRKRARNISSWKKDRAFNEVQNIIESKKYAAKSKEVEVVREA